LEYAPQDPDGFVIFGFLLMVINHVLVDVHIGADLTVLEFYLECHSILGPYTPTGMHGRINVSNVCLCSRLHYNNINK